MPSLSSPTQVMDTVYPEPMSFLHRRVSRKKRRGPSVRYRTQPVTFSEIQEVDEEDVDEATPPSSATSRSELNILNSKFEEFKRSRDLILGGKCEAEAEPSNSNKSPVVPLTTTATATTTTRSSGRLTSRPSI